MTADRSITYCRGRKCNLQPACMQRQAFPPLLLMRSARAFSGGQAQAASWKIPLPDPLPEVQGPRGPSASSADFRRPQHVSEQGAASAAAVAAKKNVLDIDEVDGSAVEDDF